MQKEQIISIAKWSTVALIIPVLGQLFVDGWNWAAGEFVFAWVFFNILGLTFTFVTHRIPAQGMRRIAGAIVVLFFALIWALLATG